MVSSRPEMCNPSAFSSKEVYRQKVLNTEMKLIFKSLLNSPFPMNSEPRTKLTTVTRILSLYVPEAK